MDQDVIADISPERERYFGCSGRMLLPSRDTVPAFVRGLPTGQVITMDRLQRELAREFGVEVTCPVAARKALEAVARDGLDGVPYWRVLRKSGELMARFPGGVEGHAELLRAEGVALEATAKSLRVVNIATDYS